MDRKILRNAVLYECAEYFGINENIKSNNTKLLEEVLSFYADFRDKFKYDVNIESFNTGETIRTEYGISIKKSYEIHKWLEDNEILYLTRNSFDIEKGSDILIFTFTSKEDAAAFKLKWS